MSQCECSDQSACACGTPDPSLWVPCSPAWIEAGGNCATAPRLSGVTGRGVSHYHPPHPAHAAYTELADNYAKFGTGLVKDNSSLEFDAALADFQAVIWTAASDEDQTVAYDEAGLREAKTLIGMYRAAAKPAPVGHDALDKEIMRNSFEANYADWSGRGLENVQAQRMGDTYGQPKIASAWRWYQCGKGVPL